MMKKIGFFVLLYYFSCCNGSVLKIPALGRTADFGDIYDARTNKFTKDSIFKRSLTQNLKKLIENPYTRYEFTAAKSSSEKLKAFEIGGELKLQIMCGVVDVGGSAKYLTDNQYTSHHAVASYILKSRIATESFNWKDEEVKNLTDFSHVITEGTHVVIGIQYGGMGVVTLSQMVKEDINRQNIQGKLNAEVKSFANVGISGNVEGSHNSSTKDKSENLKIKVEADVNFEAEDDLTTLAGTYEFMKKLGGRLLKYNNGKGVQITFEMIPLTVISNFYQKSLPNAIKYTPLTIHHYSSINHKLIAIEKIMQSFNERYAELEENQMYYSESEQEWYEESKMHINRNISHLYQRIDKDIVEFHNHSMKHDEIEKQELHIHPLKILVENFREISDMLLEHVHLIKYASDNETIYVDSYSKLEDVKLRYKKIIFYFFFLSYGQELRKVLKVYINRFKNFRIEKNATYVLVNAHKILPIVKQEIPFAENYYYPLYLYVNESYYTYTYGRKILCTNIGLKKECAITANISTSENCTMDVIIPLGAKLPTKKFSKTYQTSVENQKYVILEILQGNIHKTKKLGQVKLQTLGEKVGIEIFDFSIEITNDGILVAEYKSQKSNKTDKFELDLHVY